MGDKDAVRQAVNFLEGRICGWTRGDVATGMLQGGRGTCSGTISLFLSQFWSELACREYRESRAGDRSSTTP